MVRIPVLLRHGIATEDNIVGIIEIPEELADVVLVTAKLGLPTGLYPVVYHDTIIAATLEPLAALEEEVKP